MEVLDRQEALVSNYEVLILLQEEDSRHKKIGSSRLVKYPENVTTLKFEALQHLKHAPCSTQSAEQISALKQELAGYDLTKAEVLQILNLRPRIPVELHLIIEECDERFSQEDLDQLIAIIRTALPRDDDEDQEVGDDEGDDAMENDADDAEGDAEGDEDADVQNEQYEDEVEHDEMDVDNEAAASEGDE